jgi:hypothetical protein
MRGVERNLQQVALGADRLERGLARSKQIVRIENLKTETPSILYSLDSFSAKARGVDELHGGSSA